MMVVLYYTILLSSFCSGHINNKMPKYTSFKNDLTDPNTDLFLNSTQLIHKYGYVSERHLVLTEDGYILSLFRIPSKGAPVLLAHGIGDSSDSWLVLGPGDSLAFLLANLGFDVWIYNARGNKYSRGHKENLSNKNYWNFSFEEMGSKDLPASIDYILSVTSQNNLSYVGFSQGTTIFFVMCSLRPDYNRKIKQAVLLAPVAWMNHVVHPFIDFLSRNTDALLRLSNEVLFEVFSPNILRDLYHVAVCRNGRKRILCELEFYLNYGLRNIENLPPERLPVIASHIPAGSSSKTFLHFVQMYGSKHFQRFDHGAEENLRVYGVVTPPEYNVTLVNAPLTLFVSEVDWFSNVPDVRTLKSKLPKKVNYKEIHQSLDFTHIEFVYGTRAKSLVNQNVIRILFGQNKKIK